jgi:multiple sugar transport system permease protein
MRAIERQQLLPRGQQPYRSWWQRAWTDVAERRAAWLFVGPPLLLLIVLVAYPTFHLFRLALSRYDMAFMREPTFIGFNNFVRMLDDAAFLGSIGNTLLLSVGAVLVEFFVGLGLALLLFEPLWGNRLIKPLFIIPMMIPPVVVGLNFRLILDTFGPLNGLLQHFGLPAVDWLGHPTWARIQNLCDAYRRLAVEPIRLYYSPGRLERNSQSTD